MPIYKPSELHQFLQELGVHPKKALSQNFLIDGNILRKIAKIAHTAPDDLVVEVGPGPGSLTEELLKSKAHILAIEKDPIFAEALMRLKTNSNALEVYCDDIMTFPIQEKLEFYRLKNKKAKVIANLPYHLTTPIIAQFIGLRQYFSTLVLMVQEEVARRFVAKPKTSEYSSFTVFLNFYTHVSYGFTVSKQCFYPAPKVDSAIVILEFKEPSKVSNEKEFFKLTRTAFNQRRKMLRSSLKDLYPSVLVEKALINSGLNPTARPEELSLEKFLILFEYLNPICKP